MKSFRLLLHLSLFIFFIPSALIAQEDVWEELQEIAIIEEKVMMPMRDGVRLATDIYRPKTDQPVPVVFSRTPYNFNTWRDGKKSNRTRSESPSLGQTRLCLCRTE